MNNFEDYADVLINNLLKLKQNDKVFISIDNYNRKFSDYLIYKIYELGIEDIYVHYNRVYSSKYKEYIDKGAKMLFFSNDKCNEFELDIYKNYKKAFMAVLPSKELVDLNKSTNKDIFESIFRRYNAVYHDSYKDNDKAKEAIINIIKNLNAKKYEDILIENQKETSLVMKNPTINLDCPRDFIPSGLSIKSNSVSGIVYANKDTILENEIIENLILVFKNNKIIDYDCKDNLKLVKDFITSAKFNKAYINSFNNSSYDLYANKGNYVLDKYSCPFISVLNGKEELILPIGAKNLTLKGYNKGYKEVYAKEKFKK